MLAGQGPRWGDNVTKDAQEILGVRGWRRASGDRNGWRGSIEEARARFGL